MKTYLFALCLTTSAASTAQRQGCILHIISHARRAPLTLTLQQPPGAHTPANTYPFTDSTVAFVDSIDHPLIITLLVEYAGLPGIKYKYPVFLMPGELFVQLDQDHEDSREYVDGPPLSHDFTALLEQPVAACNRQIKDLKGQLDAARNTRGDTQSIKAQIMETVRRCRDIPRVYIRANPGYPLTPGELAAALDLPPDDPQQNGDDRNHK